MDIFGPGRVGSGIALQGIAPDPWWPSKADRASPANAKAAKLDNDISQVPGRTTGGHSSEKGARSGCARASRIEGGSGLVLPYTSPENS